MFKKISFFGALVLVLVLMVSVTGCQTVDNIYGGISRTQGSFDNINLIPAKDYQTLGLVFSEASFDMDDNGRRGNVLTYQMLLKEAQALGADTIVNVVIDYQMSTSQQLFFRKYPIGWPFEGIKGKVTWYGSATAIKYTDILKETTTHTIFDAEKKPSANYTSESYITNNTQSKGGLFNRESSNDNSGHGKSATETANLFVKIGQFFANLFNK
ncbi:MAG: hypothetical protein FWD36_03505 [Treponema sp.]|nr:hypothetical protein [Treponema sp.]